MSKAEEQRTRRRWITFGELVAALAVIISALSFWDSHRDRVDHEVQQSKPAPAAPLRLKAVASDSGDRLTLAPLHEDQAIQSQVISFPGALGLAPVSTTGDPRIEADWFADALRKARKKAGLGEDTAGDEQLPVAIVTQYLGDGGLRSDRAVYSIGFGIDSRFLRGTTVRLRGISLAARGDATPDRLWQAQLVKSQTGAKK